VAAIAVPDRVLGEFDIIAAGVRGDATVWPDPHLLQQLGFTGRNPQQ
jgi:hypothetical protein